MAIKNHWYDSRANIRPFWLFLGVFLLAIIFPTVASAATMSIFPATGNYSTQNHFTVSVEINTNQYVNGVQGTLQFPTNKLEVIGIEKSRSIMSFWVEEPSFSNGGQIGTVHFSAIRNNPGFIGSRGNIIDVTFRVKDAGVANLDYFTGQILANDGQGTNLMTSMGSAVFTLTKSSFIPGQQDQGIKAPLALASPMQPQIKYYIQDSEGKDVLFNTSLDGPKWSQSPFVKFTWALPTDATGVAMLMDDNPETDPGLKSDILTDNKILPLQPEGKHYFHIRFINSAGAGQILHFPVFIDLHEPKNFAISFDSEESSGKGIHSTSNPKPRLSFFTEDPLSGLDRYEFKVNDGDWQLAKLESNGLLILPKYVPNTRYDLIVRAYDLAGNFVDSVSTFAIEPIVTPVITYYSRNAGQSAGPIVVEGKSAPEARIEVIFEKENSKPIVATTQAESDGSWRLVYNAEMPSGMYVMRVKQILDNGAESLYTERKIIRVDSLIGKIMEWLDNNTWYIVIFFIILAIIAQVLTVVYYRRHLGRLEKSLKI